MLLVCLAFATLTPCWSFRRSLTFEILGLAMPWTRPGVAGNAPPAHSPGSEAFRSILRQAMQPLGQPGLREIPAPTPELRTHLAALIAGAGSMTVGTDAAAFENRVAAHRKVGADPAQAVWWARQDLSGYQADWNRRIAEAFLDVGRSWSNAGLAADAVLAYGAAAALLHRYAMERQEPEGVLLAARELPGVYRLMADTAATAAPPPTDSPPTAAATTAATRISSEWIAGLRAEADEWDRIYAAWRDAVIQSPPSLLPHTGTASPSPRHQRAAMIALTQAALAAGAFCFYAIVLLAAATLGLASIILRKARPPVLLKTRWPQWATLGILLALPAMAGCWLITHGAGQDWSWLFSIRLLAAAAALLTTAAALATWLGVRFVMRWQAPRAQRRRAWAQDLMRIVTILSIASLLTCLNMPSERPAIIPPAITMLGLFAWFSLAIVAVCALALPARRLIARIRCRPPVRGSSWPLSRQHALTTTAAVGFLLHAVLLSASLWRNERAYQTCSAHTAEALRQETCIRLGRDWQQRHPLRGPELLAALGPPE